MHHPRRQADARLLQNRHFRMRIRYRKFNLIQLTQLNKKEVSSRGLGPVVPAVHRELGCLLLGVEDQVAPEEMLMQQPPMRAGVQPPWACSVASSEVQTPWEVVGGGPGCMGLVGGNGVSPLWQRTSPGTRRCVCNLFERWLRTCLR